MVELMVVLVIIGILVLLTLPRLEPLVNKAKETEAKLMLKQVYTLEKSYKYEYDTSSEGVMLGEGKRTAVLTDRSGETYFLDKGDTIDGVKIIEVSSRRVFYNFNKKDSSWIEETKHNHLHLPSRQANLSEKGSPRCPRY